MCGLITKNLEFYVDNFDTWWIALFWYMWISLFWYMWISLFWLKKNILIFYWYVSYYNIWFSQKNILIFYWYIMWFIENNSLIFYRHYLLWKLTYVCWFKELKPFISFLITWNNSRLLLILIDCRYVRGWWSCWFSCKILGKDIESLWLSFYIGKLL